MLQVVKTRGLGAEIVKCNIKSAFCLLPFNPRDFELLGICFKGKFYMDRALPIGCSVSCAAFGAFSSFLEWALCQQTGLGGVIHYLDDFLFIGEHGSSQCQVLLDSLHPMAEELGVPLVHEKTESPCRVFTSLSIQLDMVAQTSHLPEAKLDDLQHRVSVFLSCHKVTLCKLRIDGAPEFRLQGGGTG